LGERRHQEEAKMLMPKKNRDKIYEYLFKEGVCVAKKDFNQKTHPDIEGVTNLQVIKACKVCCILYLLFLQLIVISRFCFLSVY
jgi:hypothetical protein